MKKVYSMPEISITSFENEVVIAASSITTKSGSQTEFNKTIKFGTIS